eukprot:1161734-Pelagomonas_calceolata.AAC.6
MTNTGAATLLLMCPNRCVCSKPPTAVRQLACLALVHPLLHCVGTLEAEVNTLRAQLIRSMKEAAASGEGLPTSRCARALSLTAAGSYEFCVP